MGLLYCLVYFVSQRTMWYCLEDIFFVTNLLTILLGVFYIFKSVSAILFSTFCITRNMCAIFSG